MRVFQIAKELNISHQEIMQFLKKNGMEVSSHMSPIDDAAYQRILSEFSKDKEIIERYRKDQVRREIHETRLKEERKTTKHFKLLSLDEQRKLESDEKEKARIESEKAAAREKERLEQEQAERKRRELEAQEVKAGAEEPETKPETAESAKEKKPAEKGIKSKKRKLRKIDLTDIEAQIGITSRKARPQDAEKAKKKAEVHTSVKDAVRRTLAKIDSKSRKKVYHKTRGAILEDDELNGESNVIPIAEFSNVDELAKLFEVPSSDVIQKCLSLGFLATINQRLDWDVIELLASEYGYTAERITDIGEELFSLEETEDDLKEAESRAPVVTIMGHVDHGKTSILDYIRESNIVAGESGGITQHIGAYKVDVDETHSITFLDTPGHEAFTAMRARGAQVTDIVVVVVAANDGVMPQTIEAINHAKAAEVPIIVAINKIDLAGIDIDRVKRELSEHGVLVEDWGGKVQCIPVSAKTGAGIDDLLSTILLEAEMLELKANQKGAVRGTIVDARLDKGHGPIATVLIQKGTIKVGDPFICNNYPGKVRAILNERGCRIMTAVPSDAVQILGFEQVPQAADIFAVVENERDLKRIASDRQRLKREIDQKRIATISLDAISAKIREGSIKNLPLVIKADVDGSVEALTETLEKLRTTEVGIQVIHKAVGMVNESDVLLAAASDAVIIGFNVQVSSNAKLMAKQEGVEIRTYKVIYNAVEELKLALEGMLEPEKVEELLGRAVVQATFKIPNLGHIAGSKVTDGFIQRNAQARIIRDDEVIHEGTITSLKRFKEDAREVKEGLECGIGIDGFSKYQENDVIVAYIVKTVKRKLETN